MSSLFTESLNNKTLGIIFAVSVTDENILDSLNLSVEEHKVLNECKKCVEYFKREGVSANILQSDDKQINLCKSILSLKKPEKIKKLLQKFLKRVMNNPNERRNISVLSSKITDKEVKKDLIYDIPLEEESVMWKNIHMSETDNDSVSSGMSGYSNFSI